MGDGDFGEHLGFGAGPAGCEEVVLVSDSAGEDEERGESAVVEAGGEDGDAEIVGAEGDDGVGRAGLLAQVLVVVPDDTGQVEGIGVQAIL